MGNIKTYQEEYENLEKLGEGSFAAVYKVRHKTLGYIRAVRRLKNNITDENDKNYKKFIEECRLLLLLGNGGHPYIQKINQPRLLFHTEEHENQACVEMEYIKGLDISKYLKFQNRFVETQEIVNFVENISSALAYCHYDVYEFLIDQDMEYEYKLDGNSKGQKFRVQNDSRDGSRLSITPQQERELVNHFKVLHNDIHAGNIIRKYNGDYILVDFGLAINDKGNISSTKKKAGVAEYWSPERFDNIISERSDIYAFGCLTFQMLTGRLPFLYSEKDKINTFEPEEVQLQRKHANMPIPAIEPLRREICETAGKKWKGKDYPEWLERVIMKCLEKKCENRYANGKELYEEVKLHIEKESKNGSVNNEEFEKLKKNNQALSDELSKLAYEKQQLEEQRIKVVEKIIEKPVEVIKTVEKRVEVPYIKTVEKEVVIKKNKPFLVATSAVLAIICVVLLFTRASNNGAVTDTEQVAQLQSQVETLQTENNNLQRQLSSAGNNSELQNMINQKNSEITDLKRQLSSAQSDNSNLADLQRRISQLEVNKVSLRNQLATAKNNSGNTASLQQQVNNLNAKVREKDAEITKLQKALKTALQ
jgi:serine/threonine protein kinase